MSTAFRRVEALKLPVPCYKLFAQNCVSTSKATLCAQIEPQSAHELLRPCEEVLQHCFDVSNCVIGWRNKPIRWLSHMGGRLTQRSGRRLATAMKTMQRLFLKFDPGGAFLACGQLVGRAGMEWPGRTQ